MSEQNTLTLDAPELSISDYRALREGRAVTAPVAEETTPSAAAAADAAPADAETAVAEDTEKSSEETSKEESKEPNPKKDKLHARFSELTGKIKALETQLADAKTRGTGQTDTAEAKPVETPVADSKDPEPDPSKFTDYVEWQKAWNRWDRRQEQRAETAKAAAAEQKKAAAARAEAWQSRVSEASKEMPDFAEVAQDPHLPVTQVMGEAILDSELGPKILYHLGQNPELSAKIAKLSPVAQVREIGKIEASLSAKAAAAEETPQQPKPVSKAPPPHKPVGGAATSSAKSVDSMSLAEYRALRESGKLR